MKPYMHPLVKDQYCAISGPFCYFFLKMHHYLKVGPRNRPREDKEGEGFTCLYGKGEGS